MPTWEVEEQDGEEVDYGFRRNLIVPRMLQGNSAVDYKTTAETDPGQS